MFAIRNVKTGQWFTGTGTDPNTKQPRTSAAINEAALHHSAADRPNWLSNYAAGYWEEVEIGYHAMTASWFIPASAEVCPLVLGLLRACNPVDVASCKQELKVQSKAWAMLDNDVDRGICLQEVWTHLVRVGLAALDVNWRNGEVTLDLPS